MATQETYKKKIKKFSDKSKSFCSLLWTHLCVETSRDFKYCCIADMRAIDTTKVLDSRIQSIGDFWNNEYVNETRKDMLNGKRVSACWRCWTVEDAGGESSRIQANEQINEITNDKPGHHTGVHELTSHWKELYENLQATINNKTMPHSPVSFDIKFGNLCNLQCRMCNPNNSSEINKEAKKNKHLYEEEKYFDKALDDREYLWFKSNKSKYREFQRSFSIKDPSRWPSNSGIDINTYDWWEDLNQHTDKISKMKFTGGEPLLIIELRKFLKSLISKNKAKDMQLQIITNATKINKTLIEEVFLKFKSLKVNVSVDGIGDNYEYIRYPGKWNVVDKNLQLLSKYKNIQFSLVPTLQFHNLYNLIDIFKYAEKNDFMINEINFVDTPSHYAPRNLPMKIKNRIFHNYRSRVSLELKRPYHKKLLNRIVRTIPNLKVHDKEAMKKFVKYTNTLDKIRGQSFKESCPQEWNLLKEYFND